MGKENFINILEDYLGGVESLENYGDLGKKVLDRKAGKEFSFDEHLKGMVYALLTNQTQWSRIEPNIEKINELFFNFNTEKVKATDYLYFEKGLRDLKCGNISIHKQMETLHENIKTMEKLAAKYGSMDKYVTSKRADFIVKELSNNNSEHKLKCMGEALVWEYLRNVGIDGVKPDTHLRRFFSSDRMGNGSSPLATEDEVIEQANQLAKSTGKELWEIDDIIWEYCADGYEEICTDDPLCEECVISEFCHKHKK